MTTLMQIISFSNQRVKSRSRFTGSVLLAAFLATAAGGCSVPGQPSALTPQLVEPERVLGASCAETLASAVTDFKRLDYAAAIERLSSVRPPVCGNDYERARVDHFLSLAYFEVGSYDDALSYMLSAVESKLLDEVVHEQSLYNVARLLYLRGDFEQALVQLKSVDSAAIQSKPEIAMLKARILYAMGSKDEAASMLARLYEQHLAGELQMSFDSILLLEKLRSELGVSAG